MLGLHRWETINVFNLPVLVRNRLLNSKSSRNKAVRPSSLPVRTRVAKVLGTESRVKSRSFEENPKSVLTYGASAWTVRQDDFVEGDDVVRRGGAFQMKTKVWGRLRGKEGVSRLPLLSRREGRNPIYLPSQAGAPITL
jgi:hypothetical protein